MFSRNLVCLFFLIKFCYSLTPNSNIIIVGGGVSGLAAFNQLRNSGFKNITILEADRLGGRIYSIPFGIHIFSFRKISLIKY